MPTASARSGGRPLDQREVLVGLGVVDKPHALAFDSTAAATRANTC